MSDSTVGMTAREQLHEQVYYTAARVRTNEAGGSGVCVYSDRDSDGSAHTFILTNHHVVEGAIEVEERFDPTLKREYPQEESDTITVEFFQYNEHSKEVGSESYQADIVAWDDKDRRDLALLKLRESEETMGYVAEMLPYDERSSIYLGDKVYAVGAALGYPVFQTPGEVTNAYYEVGGQPHIGINSPIAAGNSGGGLFKQGSDGNYYYIGAPARVAVSGFSAIEHMGFAVPLSVIYQFLEDNKMEFIWSDDYTVGECEARREEMLQRQKTQLMGEG